LLNRAARFFPILRELRSNLPAGGTVLEVGSGSLGLGEYWNFPFVGCDLVFPHPPAKNMKPVQCSGHQLPFRDSIFDAVVLSDVVEHVPPALRKEVISEALRVSRGLVIVGYPCGPAAFAADRALSREYDRRQANPPGWLVEHMQHTFPDEDLVRDVPHGWKTRTIPNENLRFHLWMMKAEMSRLWNRAFRSILNLFPSLVDFLLQRVNREPSYRKIFVITRELERRSA
jgi:hypothetical protein